MTTLAIGTKSAAADPRERGSARTKGLALSAAVALISIGGLWWVASSNAKPKTPVAQDIHVDPAPTAETELTGSDITLQLVDKNDPGRLAAELKLPSIQPLEGKRYAVEKPTGWLYPRDGRIIWIQADRADLFLPNRQQLPERGDFRGNVIVRMFEGPAGRKLDPAKETPLLQATSEHMAFDGAIGELQIPERLVVQGSGVQYAGKNIRALFNDPEQRLEFLTAESSEYLRYDPKQAKQAPSLWFPPERVAAAAPPPSNPPSRGAESGKSAPSHATTAAVAKREHLYHISVEEDVRASQGNRTIESGLLEVFARLIDNQFPNRKTETTTRSSQAKPAATTWKVTNASMRQPAEGTPLPKREEPDTPSLSRGSNDDPVELVWKGRLEIRPQTAKEDLLDGNDLALRFVGDASRVRLSDSGAKVRGISDFVSYLDTKREARISSRKPDDVILIAENSGRAIVTEGRINLATGTASFIGSGRLENSDSSDPTFAAERGVAWKNSGTLVFAPDAKGDPKTLKSAEFAGTVNAFGGRSNVQSDSLLASFDPAFGDRPLLQTVALNGNVRAADAQGANLAAKSMEVRFSSPVNGKGEALAQVLTARGAVVGSAKGATLRAEELDATLGTDFEGKTAALVVAAREKVEIEGKDGLRAECDELAADVAGENAELAGGVVILAKGESNVTGTRMRLSGATSRLEVIGSGVFHHEGKNKAGVPQIASAKWSQGMTFEDATGELVALGEAVAEAMPDPRTRDKLQAESVRVQLTPAGENKASIEALGEGGVSGPAREIVSMVATGTDAAPAKVESRRFEGDIGDGENAPKLERLLYLESREVQADNRAGTLVTPGPGKILVVDQREAAKGEKAEPQRGFDGPTGRGSTLFSWRDSMSMERPTQTMRMNGTVKMTNVRAGDKLRTQLDCDRLTAILLESGKTGAGGSLAEMKGELARAIAEGNARLVSGAKNLSGEIIDYNAVEGIATAGSPNGGMVTLIDSESASPISARSIVWDLLRGRVEVRSVSTVVAPK